MLKQKYLIALTLALGTSLISASQVLAESSINVNRLAGQDRYGTSNAIVSQGWIKSDYAILVNSQNFPDAITSSPLAKKYNAPILLTDVSSLTDSTKQKLQDLGVKSVFIIGGPGVVNSKVENTLRSMGISVNRIWGQDRYATSVNVAKELGTSKGVFVVNGEHYEDALSVAPIADKLQYPIVLVSQNSVPDVVRNYANSIKSNGGEVEVIGGQDVLSNDVVNTLNPTKTYNQSTKYDRNLALINNYSGQLELSGVYVASDKGFADALSGSALAGQNGNPIILVGDGNQININSFINNNNVSNINVLGGTGVLSDSTVSQITGETNTNNIKGATSVNNVGLELIDKPTISDSDINSATDISFTSGITANDLKIDSWKMYNNGTNVEFFVTYESGIDRYVSFFNPPNGDIFMKTSGTKLSAGTNNLKFEIPVGEYNSIKDGITMKFWSTDSDNNYIYFNPNQKTATNQLIDTSISDSDISSATDISFTSGITANDLKIDSWKMYNNGTNVEFFVTYESGIDRYVSFFNPPNGDIFMKTSGTKLSAGTNNLKFEIPVGEYNSIKDGITMKFWSTDNDNNYIYFNPNQK